MMKKSMQRSRKLLLSEAISMSRGARNFTIQNRPNKKASFPISYVPAPDKIRSQRDVAAPKRYNSRETTFHPPSNEPSIKKQNLAFEDQSRLDASHFDLPATERHIPMPPDLLKSNPDFDTQLVAIGKPPHFHPVYLRDACPCSRCVDPSSTQKTFQTTDIPVSITASSVEDLENGDLKITWENDIPGFEDHVSVYPKAFFTINRTRSNQTRDRSNHINAETWNKFMIKEKLNYVTYDQWMTDDDSLGRALFRLQKSGLLIVRDVPETETAVEHLTQRMGPIRDSFYGRTWDVRSVPEAKNVAYTQKYLGLHMDLLYMADPPGFQFLHCLKNSCEGGESIFVDSFHAAGQLHDTDFDILVNAKLGYHYRNAGEHYYHEHCVIDASGDRRPQDLGRVFPARERRASISCVNYSPPFQAPTHSSQSQMHSYNKILRSLRNFARKVEGPGNLFEYKLKPGECVIFNNRRVLHGRRQFQAAGGERWLKGAYVDTDAFKSRMRAYIEKVSSEGRFAEYPDQYVFPESIGKVKAFKAKKRLAAAERGT